MTGAANLFAVILAAGESTRMGSDKALLPWPPVESGTPPSGQTFLSAAIQSLDLWSELVIVVVGKNAANVAPVAYENGAAVVVNPAPARGQFSSLQVGLQEVLNRGRDAAMVTLVDRPPATAETLDTLSNAFLERSHDTWALVPEYGGKHGHPFLVGREMIEAFLKAEATANAREIEHQNQQHVQYLAIEDPAVTLNVDTPEDYAALTKSVPSR
jgi:molybdenum cofactor cytidylyltransferase